MSKQKKATKTLLDSLHEYLAKEPIGYAVCLPCQLIYRGPESLACNFYERHLEHELPSTRETSSKVGLFDVEQFEEFILPLELKRYGGYYT